MWTCCNTSELTHHGIKGMRWGVRRFQKKDGSLTPAGKKRYDDSPNRSNKPGEKKKSKHRQMLEEKYVKAGMSQKEAEIQAKNRIRTEKLLLAAAGVTATACAAYVIHNKLKDRVDGIIKAGESLQRVEMQDTGGKLHDVFYTSKGKHDNARYKGLLGLTRHQQTGHAYLMKLEAGKDIKVASKEKAAKLFGEMYKNDPDFRRQARDHVSAHFTGKNKLNPDNLSDRNIRKLYENFNANLIDARRSGSGVDVKFYNKLKSQGYGAIQDINDMKFSGYKAKNPLIVFGNSDNIMVKSVTKLNDKEVMVGGLKEVTKAQGEKFVEKTMTKYGPVAAAGFTAIAATSYAEDRSQQNNYT